VSGILITENHQLENRQQDLITESGGSLIRLPCKTYFHAHHLRISNRIVGAGALSSNQLLLKNTRAEVVGTGSQQMGGKCRKSWIVFSSKRSC
jgi:hypothetical protein